MTLQRISLVLLPSWSLGVLMGTILGITHFHTGILISFANSIFLSLISAFAGPFVGLISTEPYFVWQFKFGLVLTLFFAVILFRIALSRQLNWWRYMLGVIAFNLWIITGLIGFGPQ